MYSKPLGWVLYDGACGFCSWWIPFWRKTINKTGYDIAPLQAKWVRDKLNLPGEQINRDILLLLADGKVIAGADAYIYGMKKVRWSRPAGYLLGLPGFRWLTWQFYKLFNRNRLFVSRVCKLRPELSQNQT
jgi:predicted DCC family thiol-disulfide oxidoreductase YuxK